jgi:hypothetical protein
LILIEDSRNPPINRFAPKQQKSKMGLHVTSGRSQC